MAYVGFPHVILETTIWANTLTVPHVYSRGDGGKEFAQGHTVGEWQSWGLGLRGLLCELPHCAVLTGLLWERQMHQNNDRTWLIVNGITYHIRCHRNTESTWLSLPGGVEQGLREEGDSVPGSWRTTESLPSPEGGKVHPKQREHRRASYTSLCPSLRWFSSSTFIYCTLF